MPSVLVRFPKRPMHVVVTAVMTLNFLLIGIVYTSLPGAIVFVAVIALLMSGVFTITSILLMESLPGARGAVMALQSAANQSGVAIGAAWAGGALALLGTYPATYRSIGLWPPMAILCLWMSWRAARTLSSASRAPVDAIEAVAVDPAI